MFAHRQSLSRKPPRTRQLPLISRPIEYVILEVLAVLLGTLEDRPPLHRMITSDACKLARTRILDSLTEASVSHDCVDRLAQDSILVVIVGRVITMSFGEKSGRLSPNSQTVAILVPQAARVRAWIVVLAEELKNRLGVAAPLVTITGTGLARTITLPERLERLIIKSSKDFGRLVDVATHPVESLSTSPTLIIDATGQLNSRFFTVPILSFVLNGQMVEEVIVRALWSTSRRKWVSGWRPGKGRKRFSPSVLLSRTRRR